MSVKKVENVFRNLPVTSLLRAFAVMEDEEKVRFLNIFRSFIIGDSVRTNAYMFQYYQVEEEEFLDDISYKSYGTPSLWWMIAEFNEITNPFEALEEGESLKILSGDYLYSIFDNLQDIGDL